MRLAVSALYDAVVGQIFYPIGVDRSADAAYAVVDTALAAGRGYGYRAVELAVCYTFTVSEFADDAAITAAQTAISVAC